METSDLSGSAKMRLALAIGLLTEGRQTELDLGDELGTPTPLGPCYMAANARGVDLDTFLDLVSSLSERGFITFTSETFKLTDLGRRVANQILVAKAQMNELEQEKGTT